MGVTMAHDAGGRTLNLSLSHSHRSMSSTFTSVGMSVFSFCRPSRGPTCSVQARVYMTIDAGWGPHTHAYTQKGTRHPQRTSTMRTALGALGKGAAAAAEAPLLADDESARRRVVQPWQHDDDVADGADDMMAAAGLRRRRLWRRLWRVVAAVTRRPSSILCVDWVRGAGAESVGTVVEDVAHHIRCALARTSWAISAMCSVCQQPQAAHAHDETKQRAD